MVKLNMEDLVKYSLKKMYSNKPWILPIKNGGQQCLLK
jgi:hypothetical protein